MAKTVIQIASTGSWLPEKRVTNDMLSETLDTTDEWIISHTGIRARHIASEEHTTSYGATQAARIALERAGVEASELGYIVLATTTPDYLLPAASCLVHRELKAGRAAAFDISAACTGFVYALSIVQGLMANDPRPGLVIGADLMTRIVDWSDRNTCVLFGDGAGAVVLKHGTGDFGLAESIMKVDSDGFYTLRREGGTRFVNPELSTEPTVSHYIHMDGKPVFNFAVKAIAEIISELLQKANLTMDDIKYIVPHQANFRIIDAAARRLGTTTDKFFLNIAEVANTSAASIPIALDELIMKGRVEPGDPLIFVGFGAGLTYGGTLVRWGHSDPLATV
ncbi:MAG: ketoacyl-ACP synthase III [Lentisphaerae bacterium]|nr:ketoacyl-ACP synthase III [Lentisphaerota bacterium]